MSMQVKGAVVVSRRAFVREEFGHEAWDRVLDALPVEVRDQISSIIVSSAWYPFEVSEKLDAAIVQVCGGGRREVFKKIGANSAQKNLRGAHAHFLAAGDPAAFMDKTARIYEFYYAQGHRSWEPSGANAGVMTTYEAETFSEPDCLTVVGWYEEALKMCGARTVTMTETKCRARGDEVCQYQVRWTI